jgi:hypothetical protein
MQGCHEKRSVDAGRRRNRKGAMLTQHSVYYTGQPDENEMTGGSEDAEPR